MGQLFTGARASDMNPFVRGVETNLGPATFRCFIRRFQMVRQGRIDDGNHRRNLAVQVLRDCFGQMLCALRSASSLLLTGAFGDSFAKFAQKPRPTAADFFHCDRRRGRACCRLAGHSLMVDSKPLDRASRRPCRFVSGRLASGQSLERRRSQ